MTDSTEFLNALVEKIIERSEQVLENSKEESRSIYAEAREVLLIAELSKLVLSFLPVTQIDTWAKNNRIAYLLMQLAEINSELRKGGEK